MIRFGLIGAGRIANAFAVSIKTTTGSLAAVASRDIEKARAFKEKYGLKSAYGSYQALMRDASIDCIYVATPHALHYEQMLQILDYDKHILCEKPFTLNHTQAKTVFAKAKKKRLFVMEAMWTRFLPVINEVETLIKTGAVGTVTHMEASFHFNPEKNAADRLFKPELGGGALLDIGIYPMTIANLFLGKPKRIDATVHFFHTGVDLEETIVFHYDTAKAYLSASLDKEEKKEATITTTKGSIVLPNFFAAEQAMIYDKNGTLIKTIEHKHEGTGFEYEIQDVINCIESKRLESQRMPHAKTIEILKQMDELRERWNFIYPQEH